jgi:ribosomal protein L11 methyltransferase
MASSSPKRAAVWTAWLETDEQSAHKLDACLNEHLETPKSAVTLVENGRGDWQMGIHFGAPPDKPKVRSLVSAAAGPAVAKRLRFERVTTKDWVKESLAGLKPVQAGRFLVHGAHDRAHLPPNRIGIEIEAALAFGTGHHGTTRGCLLALNDLCERLGKMRRARRPPPFRGRTLKNREARGLRILDLGTGSGVLAIAAARALRQRVLATDIDTEALRVARGNARLNCVAAFIDVAKADGIAGQRIHARAPFDLVFANILLGPLQQLAAPLAKLIAPGGRIILSGLLASQANAALSAYHRLTLERRIDLDGWTTLVMRRVPVSSRR